MKFRQSNVSKETSDLNFATLKKIGAIFMSKANKNTSFYNLIPSLDKLMREDVLVLCAEKFGNQSIKLIAQEVLGYLREKISASDVETISVLGRESAVSDIAEEICARATNALKSPITPVFNLTGTVIHTNLGRAALAPSAVVAMTQAAEQTTNLEYDLETGKRGDRDTVIEGLLCDLTGSEAATVVNNNAAAVLLTLNSLARGKKVVISRGELVEIGGAFRIPEVMTTAGCSLFEVGTTNRTHLNDYASAFELDEVALLMKVHSSNYEIKGFTSSVSERELASLARQKDVPLISDLGSGSLINLSRYGLPSEPTVKDVIADGANIVTFSGDKLLGGPQVGIIVGSKKLIGQIKSNPLKRALRVDKTILAALLGTLRLYQDPASLSHRLPILRNLTRNADDIQALAHEIAPKFVTLLSGIAVVTIEDCMSQIGSGALPLDLMPSSSVVLAPVAEKGQRDIALQKLAKSFRCLPKPIIGRISDGRLFFDLRCLWDKDELLAQLDFLK
jgi:L-seryl-tRNA(Ser) seleniumtransferase